MPRVAIIDDIDEARTLVRVVLGMTPGNVVVAEATDIDDASLTRILSFDPDVIVVDRRLPSGDGASLVTRVSELGRGAPKVVLYSIGDPFPSPLLEQPDAYVLIDDDIEELAVATARVVGAAPH
jgi:DNA-binding NarL/FixJ family response regulator